MPDEANKNKKEKAATGNLKKFFKKVVDFSKITCYNDYVIGIWQRILNGYDGLV